MPQYNGVWTLEAQAQAQSNQQWVTDPNFKNTTLLLQADGTGSGSQNNTFLDSSTNNFFITRNGNTTQGSFSPFSQAPGYWSNYFDGTDDDLSIASNVNLTPAAGDFTLECWIFPTSWASLGSYRSVIGGPTSGCMFFGQTSTGFGLRALAVADVVVTTTLPPTNAWTHVAVSRSGTSARLFINGALVATATDSTNFAQTQVVIANTSVAGTEEYSGYISNLRFIKGTALYTSAFTPQTSPLTAVTNTQLLTCQSNRFVDNSTNAFSLSVGGTPSVQAFGPFAPALQWTSDVVGGSAYFDGTGDYLTGPSASGGDFSTGDFTISAWFYPTTLTGGVNHGVMAYADTGGWNGWQLQARGSTKDMLFEFLTGSAGASTITGGTIVLNAWNYVVVTRSGSTLNLYVNSTSVAATTTNSTAYGAATSRVIVGADRSAASPFIGYISNSKLVKQANAPASIPTVPDTNTTNTSLLLNYTNAGIYDGAMDNVLETAGNAQVSTSVVKYGSGSMYFDGAGDYLSFPNNFSFQFSTGAFTIEFWYFPIASLTNAGLVDLRANSSSGAGVLIRQGDTSSIGTGIACWAGNPGSTTGATQTGLVLNQWNHIAATRDSLNYLRVFINGVSGTAVARSIDLTDSSCRIAAFVDATGSPNAANGFIDDLRITKGVCRYIANFTPPQQALPRQ